MFPFQTDLPTCPVTYHTWFLDWPLDGQAYSSWPRVLTLGKLDFGKLSFLPQNPASVKILQAYIPKPHAHLCKLLYFVHFSIVFLIYHSIWLFYTLRSRIPNTVSFPVYAQFMTMKLVTF